jgi:hypothetical protein
MLQMEHFLRFLSSTAERVPLLRYMLDLCNREVVQRHTIPFLVRLLFLGAILDCTGTG